MATIFNPSVGISPPYYIKGRIGRNQYWSTAYGSYEITVLDLALVHCRENVAIILIDRRADIFTQDEFGNTPLHIAAGQGLNTAVIKLLEKIKKTKPQALDLQNKAGKTPLHFAVDCDRKEVIKTLLDGGANPITVDNWGNTALHLAIEQKLSEEIIIEIIEATKAQSIHLLGQSRRTEPSLGFSGQLIHNGLDRDAKRESTIKLLKLKNNMGHTALSHAVYYRCEDISRILLKSGADPTITDFDGNTSLHLAAQQILGHEIIFDIIKAASSKAVNILGHNEMTNPSGCSSGTMDHDGLDRKAIGEAASEIINLRNNEGQTALLHAVYHRRKEVSRILLSFGADPTITDLDGNTALHLAIQRNLGNEIIIEIIKAAREKAVNILGRNEMTNLSGCSSKAMDHDGLEPNAIGEATSEILNLRNNKGHTALLQAVYHRRHEISRILLNFGADPTITDNSGTTALYLAIERNLSEETIFEMIEATKAQSIHVLGHGGMTEPSLCLSEQLIHNGLDRYGKRELTTKLLKLTNLKGHTALSHAVFYHREEISRLLLDLGADPTISDIDGNTPLHLAIQEQLSDKIIIDIIKAARAKAVDILRHNELTNPSRCSSGTMIHDGLDRNAIGKATSEILNLRNNVGRTPFCTAVYLNRGIIANILFLNGADPTISDNYGDSPLHTNLPTDMTDEMIILMIENIGVNHVNRHGSTLLRDAIRCKREVLVKNLLKRGAIPVILDWHGDSALHLAVERGLGEQIIIDIIEAARPKPIHFMFQNPMTTRFYTCFIQRLIDCLMPEVVFKILTLSCDAIINSKNHIGQTAVFLAVLLDRFKIAQILLENGADPTIADDQMDTPLHSILHHETDDSILVMIQNIDVNHRYNDGSTLFHNAIKCRREVVVMKLLKRGADPIIADANGNTALHLAIEHYLSAGTIISILEAATPRTADILGQNGMTDPSVCSNGELVHDRLDRDVNRQATSEIINFRNQNWQTGLFLAFTLARFDIVKILLERGADPNIADIHGHTPLHIHMPAELTDEIIISMIKTIDVNHAGNDLAILLLRAIECRREVVIMYLLNLGVNPLIPDLNKNATALGDPSSPVD